MHNLFAYVLATFVLGFACHCQLHAACASLPNNLAAWWQLNGTAADTSGNNTFTLSGGAGYATGETEQGLSFPGGYSGYYAYARATAASSLNVGSASGFSAEMWIKPNNASSLADLIEWNDQAGHIGAHLSLSTAADKDLYANIVDAAGVSHQISSGANAIQSGVFQHVALTYDKSSGIAKLYVNGSQVASQNLGTFTPQTSYAFFVGNRPSGPFTGISFGGVIDELALYSRVLSAVEIQSIHVAGSAGKCTGPSCASPPSNLTAWWQLDGTAADTSGNNNLTLYGNVRYGAGEVGQGLSFPGGYSPISDYARAATSSSLNVGTAGGFTVDMWIKPNNASAIADLIEWNDMQSHIGAHLSLSTAADKDLYANIVDTAGVSHQISSGANAIQSGVFQHVALTYDKSSGIAKLYVNGSQVASQNLGTFTPQTSYEFFVGNRPSGPFTGIAFIGALDELSLYGRALSLSEVQAIFNSGVTGKCPPPFCASVPNNLAAWWQLNGTAADTSGNNLFTLVGNVSYGTGEAGQGLSFPGGYAAYGDYARAAAASGLNVGSASGFSAEMWIKPNNASSLADLIEWNDQAGHIGAHLSLSTAADKDLYANIVDAAGVSHQISSGANAIQSGVFQHVALTYDKSSGIAKLYVNGSQVASQNLGTFTPQTSYAFFVGNRPSGPFTGIAFAGALDEASLYSRALTAVEIQTIHIAGTTGKCTGGSGVPPAITTQPQGQTVNVGGTATFQVVVTGSNPLTYEWRFNGMALGAPSSSSLVLNNVQLNQAGSYSVRVFNAAGTVTSQSATLTVNNPNVPPQITVQPQHIMTGVGRNVAFSVTASGGTLSYQWYRNGQTISGANQATLSLNAVQSAQAGTYTVTVSNPGGSTPSAPAALTVLPLGSPLITEFVAENEGGYSDEDGDTPGWIEIFNPDNASVALLGWYLTDDAANRTKWAFPAVNLPANSTLIVFASGKDRHTAGAPLHTGFQLDPDGEYLALIRPDGVTIASEYTPEYPEQRVNVAFGLGGAASALYFIAPTPNSANSVGVPGFVADTHFTPNRGFFFAAFDAIVTSSTPGATIVYTTDGSEPTLLHGTVVNPPNAQTPPSATIHITATTTLRAAAFKDGLGSTDVDTETYIFPNTVASQQSPAGAATQWKDDPANPGSYATDFQVDTSVEDASYPGYTFTAALLSVPTLSIVGPVDGLFGAINGIYTHPVREGAEWERRVSVELFFPDGTDGFHTDAGLRMHGAVSRQNVLTPKHPMRLLFRGQYGAAKLRYSLFPDTEVDEFDDLVLRACSTDAFAIVDNFPFGLGQNTRATYQRDQWMRDTQRDMEDPAPHGRYVNVYLNGLYWGVYNLTERVGPSFAASHLGGGELQQDVIGYEFAPTIPTSGHMVVAGDETAWNQLRTLATDVGTDAADPEYWRLQGLNVNGTRNLTYPVLLDMDNFIDYMILHIYAKATDWPNRNWYAMRRKDTSPIQLDSTGFKFIAWDQEIAIDWHTSTHWHGTVYQNVGDGNLEGQADTPAEIYAKIRDNDEFKIRFADRVQRHLFTPGGLLTVTANQNRWTERATEIDYAIVGESARWGDAHHSPDLTREDNWLVEKNWVQNTFWAQNHLPALQRFRSVQLFPSIDAPTFNISVSFQVTMNNPNASGSIFYTLNGNDPRLAGALVYDGTAITINAPTLVRARVKSGNVWSAMEEATVTPPQDLTKLALTEIMYNPPETTNPDNYEFLELKNIGAVTLDLSGFQFNQGITYTFPDNTLLGAGEFFLLVKNKVAFETKYPGVTADDEFDAGTLSNGGETLTLVNADGLRVFSLQYADGPPWPAAADGLGFSMVQRVVDSQAPDDGAKWRASSLIKGSPGADDGSPSVAGILVTEVLSATTAAGGDQIELYNPTSSAVEITGWLLTNDRSIPDKYRIPTTTIAANGYAVFTEADFNPATPNANAIRPFAFNPVGEQVYLFSTNNSGYSGHSHGFSFGAADNDVSFGRYVNSVGTELFPAQSATSFGSANAGPKVGPVVITEIHYHPGAGGDEFVELKNISGANVDISGWRVDGVGFTIPTIAVVSPGGFVLVVTNSPAAFRTKYSVPEAVPIVGPYGNAELDNGGESVRLQHPNGVNVWVTVDEVRYNDRTPWPSAPDGSGPSLNRNDALSFGNDPVNWTSADITPGAESGGLPSPLGPASTLLFTSVKSVERESGKQLLLTFSAAANTAYVVLWSQDLTNGEWHVLENIEAETSGRLVTVTDEVAPGSEHRFYRLAVAE